MKTNIMFHKVINCDVCFNYKKLLVLILIKRQIWDLEFLIIINLCRIDN